jgi:hypothetical protein
MKRPEDSVLRPPSVTAPAPAATLADIGFACLGEGCGPGQGVEADWLLGQRERLGEPGGVDNDGRAAVEGRARAALARWLRDPPPADHALPATNGSHSPRPWRWPWRAPASWNPWPHVR